MDFVEHVALSLIVFFFWLCALRGRASGRGDWEGWERENNFSYHDIGYRDDALKTTSKHVYFRCKTAKLAHLSLSLNSLSF